VATNKRRWEGKERETQREREEGEGGREREELLRFAKEGMRKDLHGRRREQIRPPNVQT
jgi:hypothetical protein